MRSAFSLVVLGLVACGGSQAPAPQAAPVTPEAAFTLEKSADSAQVDRVGPGDGAGPDGTNDLGFVATLDGPVAAIFLVAVDAGGKPDGSFQADTLVGSTEVPAELGAKPGSGTSGLGVLEGDKVVNAKDGSLEPLGAGPHRLTLYVAPSPAITAGTKLRVYLQRPDKSLVSGPTVAN